MDDAPHDEPRSTEAKTENTETMSKLSPSLKTLINAPFARPGQTAAPSHIRDVYQTIARDAAKNKVGAKPWLALSVSLPIVWSETQLNHSLQLSSQTPKNFN